MGLLAKLKAMFSSNIVFSSEDFEELCVLYRNKTTKLKKGAYLLIEDKSVCIVAHKGDITDCLYGRGKFRIAKEDMPKLFSRAINKKNEEDKIIKAELYFIRPQALDKFFFFSDRPFIIKSKDYGRVIGNVEGFCTVSVTSVQDLFSWLFLIRRKFKTGTIDQIVAEQIGNTVCRAIEKSKLGIKDLVLKNSNINEYLDYELEKAFESIGLEVGHFDLKGIEFHKRNQDIVNAMLQREYEKIDKTQVKHITINMNSSSSEAEEFVLENENADAVCTNCGEVLHESHKFCPKCGSPRKK